MNYTETLNSFIKWAKYNVPEFEENELSNCFHTFNELYEFRKIYNALLFNEWAKMGVHNVHKSWRHHDGNKCFGSDDWFIVSAKLPSGLISNHYRKEDWDLFKVSVVEKALFEFDGHTVKEVLERLKYLTKGEVG